HDLRREWQRSQHRRYGKRPVIRTIGYPARRVDEALPCRAGCADGRTRRPLARGQAPAVLVVACELVRIAPGVLTLDVDRPPAVFEIVGTFFAHEAVADATK